MDKIGDLVSKRLNQHKLGESARASLVVNRANQFLQKKFPDSENEVNAFRLKDGVLYVGTAGSVWSQEVWAEQENLLAELRKEYGQKSVIKILIKGLTSS